MKEIDDAPTAGAGYSEEEIDNASGVARTSTAALGYDPADGTYTAPKKKYAQTRFTPLPTNTGNRLLDEANAQQNRIDAKLFTDPRLASLTNLFDERYGGHGFSDYRDTMDDYMLHEFGRSKYDEGATNVLTSEDAKRNRAENQSALMAVVNGGARFANRAAGTVAAGVAGIVDALASPILQQAGVSLKDYGWDAESIANRTEAGSEWLNKEIPLYQSQEDEQYAQEHPFKGAFLTRQGWANFIDNLGFTAGAAATAYGLAYMGAPISVGIGAATLAKTVQDYIASDSDMTAKDLLPLATGVAGTVLAKAVPLSSAMKTQIATLSASIISSFGEGNIEAVNAKNDFISGKSFVLDQDVAQRKQLVMREMESRLVQEKKDETAQLVKEGKMTEADALMEALRRAREAKGTREWQEQVANQMAILDWEGTRVKNRITREAESVADLTRLLNVGLLSASNMIQFGKVFNGGYKTYRTMRRVEAAKDATEAADKAYKAALRNARTSAERAGVRARRDAIRVEAMRRWADETGGRLFDEGRRLTRGDYFDIIVKNPATEGLEEVGQSMVSAGAMGASEWGVDDYYSQISGVDAYRKADSAVMAGIKSAAGKLAEAETWVEFVSGALTGALGMPGVRTPFKRDAAAAEPKDDREAARRFRLRNLQSPIFMRGGIWGEARKAKSDREAMARMAGRLNEAMTDKQLEAFRKQMGHIARHMQYEDDKRMWADGDGDKFNFENAVDADLLNSIELFQNSGNLDLLRGMAQSMLDVKTTDDLLALQSLTETDDGKGGKTGPYSEFKITNLGKDATEEQRKASEEQERLMREKIARDVKRQVRAIDAYAKARQELDFETRQGLSDDQLNCLTWYKVRLSMFDDRSKEMFDDIEDDLEKLTRNFNEIYDYYISEQDNLVYRTELEVKDKEDDEIELPDGRKITGREYLQAVKYNRKKTIDGLNALRETLRNAHGISDADWKMREIFEGVKLFDVFNKNISKKQREDIDRIANKQTGLKIIAQELNRANVKYLHNQTLSRLFGEERHRKDLARKIRDILSIQDAISRYDFLYKQYKAHPGLMAQRAREHEEEIREEAKEEERSEVKSSLSECRNKKELYATIEKMIDDGKDADVINAAIDELIKSGSALAKEFYENQKYVRYFANALTRVVDNKSKNFKEPDKTRLLPHLILQQLMLNAAAECSSCSAMREYVVKLIKEDLSTLQGMVAFLNRHALIDVFLNIDDFKKSRQVPVLDENGKQKIERVVDGIVNYATEKKNVYELIYETLLPLFNAANRILADRADIAIHYGPIEDIDKVSDFELLDLKSKIKTIKFTPYLNKSYDKVETITSLGHDSINDNADKGSTTESKVGDDGKDTVGKSKEETKQEDANKPVSSTEIVEEPMVEKVHNVSKNEVETTTEPTELENVAQSTASEETAEIQEIPTAPEEDVDDIEQILEAAGDAKEAHSEDSTSAVSLATDDELEAISVAAETDIEEADILTTSDFGQATDETADDENGYDAEDEVFGSYDGSAQFDVEIQEETYEEQQQETDSSIWRPIISFFNLELRRLGQIVRNSLTCFDTFPPHRAKPGEAVKFARFWNVLDEKLGVFRFIDENPNAVETGEPVYFVVDKMKGESSEIFGLRHFEIKFKDSPIVFMCVKRDGKFQCVGTMSTSRAKLEEYGQLEFYDEVVAKADKTDGAYVHDKRMRVKGVHRGLVEVSEGENTIDRVMDGNTPVFAVKTKKDIVLSNEEEGDDSAGAAIMNQGNMKVGRLHLLVKDNPTGTYVAMPCRIAHYGNNDIEEIKGTSKFKEVDGVLSRICQFVASLHEKSQDDTNAALAFEELYDELCELLSLAGYKVHLDLVKSRTSGKYGIQLSRIKYQDGKPVLLIDKKTGKPVFKKDESGNETVPVYEREFVNVYDSESGVPMLDRLRDALLGFNVQFRVRLSDMQADAESLANQGLITTNIEDGGGKNTRGGYVLVEAYASKPQEEESPIISNDESVDINDEFKTIEINGTVFKIRDNGEVLDIDGERINDADIIQGVKAFVATDARLRIRDLSTRTLDYEGDIFCFDEDGNVRIEITRNHRGELTFYHANLNDVERFKLFAVNDLIKVCDENGMSVDDIFPNLPQGPIYRSASSVYDDIANVLSKSFVREDKTFTEIAKRLSKFFNRIDPNDSEIIIENFMNYFGKSTILPIYGSAVSKAILAPEQLGDTTSVDSEDVREIISQSGLSPIEKELLVELYKHQRQLLDNKGNLDAQETSYSLRREKDASKPKVNISKEIEALRTKLPWLSRENAIRTVKCLINVGQNGRVAQGLYRQGLIVLSREAVRGTLFHEAFHAVFQTALTEKERQEMIGQISKDFSFVNPIEAEEFLADQFAKYMVDREYGRSLGKRIMDFFEHLWNMLSERGKSLSVMQDLFDKINAGGFANRGFKYENHVLERRKWWVRQGGMTADEVFKREDAMTSFESQPSDVRQMLAEAGWTEAGFNRLTQEQREDAIRCL